MKIGRKLFLGGKGDEKLAQKRQNRREIMSKVTKRRLQVEELCFIGYSPNQIVSKLGAPLRTIHRDIADLREKSDEWLENLANRDYAMIYREALEGFRSDMVRLHEMLENENVMNNPILQIKIIKEISQARHYYLEHLNAGPIVWSMENLIKRCSPQPIPQPTMKCLEPK